MESLCRTCLKKCRLRKSVSIFGSPMLWGKHLALAKLIMACAPIRIKKDDGLPFRICEDCLKLLQLSFLFRLRVIASDEKLRESTAADSKEDLPRPLLLTGEWGGLDQVYSLDHIMNSALAEANYVDDDGSTTGGSTALPTTIQNNTVCNTTSTGNNNIAMANQIINTSQINSSNQMTILQPDSNTTASNVPNIVFLNPDNSTQFITNQNNTTVSSTQIHNNRANAFQTYQVIPLENGTSTIAGGATLFQELITNTVPDSPFPTLPLSSFEKISSAQIVGTLENIEVIEAPQRTTPRAGTIVRTTLAALETDLPQIQNVMGSYGEPMKPRVVKYIKKPKEIDDSDESINIDLTGDEDILTTDANNSSQSIEDIVIPIDDTRSSSSNKRLSNIEDENKTEPDKKKVKRRSINDKKPPLKIDEALIVID